MDHPFYQVIEEYGIYAVFLLCTVEGDITLLISGVLAHSGFFGPYSFLKVFFFGTLGGVVGDSFGYMIGRLFHETVKNYRFYQMTQPRVEKLIEKFGGLAIIISKYIYGIRVAMCLFYGIGRMPFWRWVMFDSISCGIWVTILAGVGYFFSGAITSIIGDYSTIGIALFFIVMVLVIVFYVIERYWLSERVEEANPTTILKLEEKFHQVEEVASVKLHDLGERLHLTREPSSDDRDNGSTAKSPEKKTADTDKAGSK